jgi:hypothetical protein
MVMEAENLALVIAELFIGLEWLEVWANLTHVPFWLSSVAVSMFQFQHKD